jgi:peptide deformylase
VKIVSHSPLDLPRQIGDPVLHSRADDVVEFSAKLQNLVQGMQRTMQLRNGVGIAAPQIGVAQRVFLARFERELVVCINPSLTIVDETSSRRVEGCLSIDGEAYLVPRAKTVLLEAFSVDGEPFSRVLDGYSARIAQHEMDHLEGLLIADRGQRLSALPHTLG